MKGFKKSILQAFPVGFVQVPHHCTEDRGSKNKPKEKGKRCTFP